MRVGRAVHQEVRNYTTLFFLAFNTSQFVALSSSSVFFYAEKSLALDRDLKDVAAMFALSSYY
ncbi:MAG: hypothetical protein KKD18_05125 [Nanoarchaeota archaeon]|nr:hypothetical protein [Nanoarchaeota archaeon]